MYITYALFVAGFIILIKGADYLVEGAASIAKKYGWSSLFIGLTIVAFGTSAPELFVNIIASINGNSGIAVGNILGSNISNILLILGTAALVHPLVVRTNTISKEIPLSLLAIIVLGVLVNDQIITSAHENILSRADGLILIFFFCIFLYYVAGIRKGGDDTLTIKTYKTLTAIGMVALGLVGLTLGGKWIVEGGVVIAGQLGLSEELIGLTIIAIGTSLPELATSAVAAYKGNTDMAIGNVVGSNIFNIFWVLGVSSLIQPIAFSQALNFDILTVVLVTVVLLISIYIGTRYVLSRREGYSFIILYIIYIAFLIYRG